MGGRLNTSHLLLLGADGGSLFVVLYGSNENVQVASLTSTSGYAALCDELGLGTRLHLLNSTSINYLTIPLYDIRTTSMQ